MSTEKKTLKPKRANLPKAIAKEETPVINKPLEMSAAEKAHMKSLSTQITKEMNTVESSFLKVAFALKEFSDKQYFTELGYKNIYDYAKAEHNIARGTCNNFINVVKKFGKVESAEKPVKQLDDCYKGYSASKLIMMLGMTDKELKQLNPDMSVRQIKALKNSVTNENEENSDIEGGSANENVIDIDSVQILTNSVMELTIDSFRDVSSDVYELHLKNLLECKVNVLLKLLQNGHKIQIVESVEEYATARG